MAWPPRVSAPRFASGATANVTAAPLLISGAHTRMHARAHACVHRRARARRARPSCVRLRVLTVRIACARTHGRAQRPADVEESRQGLPIIDMEQEIMEAIAGNLVTVLCGATGHALMLVLSGLVLPQSNVRSTLPIELVDLTCLPRHAKSISA